MKLFNCRQMRFLKHIFPVFIMVFQLEQARLSAQTFAFQHLTEKEGLPSRYLYDLRQHADGHIWLSGEAGLLWYDGENYIKPFVQDLLKDEVIRFFQDDQKQLWMQDLAGRILLFKNDKLIEFPEIAPTVFYTYTEWYNDPNGEIWIANTDYVFNYNAERDSLIKIEVTEPRNHLVSLKVFTKDKKGNTLLLTRTGFYVFEKEKNYFQPYKNGEVFGNFDISFEIDNQEYIVLGSSIHYFNGETLIPAPQFEPFEQYFQDVVLEVHKDRENRIWISTRNGLLMFEENEDQSLKMTRHLEGEVMGGILEDSEGNLWFSTSQNGLYKLPSRDILIYKKNELDKQIRFIKTLNSDYLIAGFDNNYVKILDKSFNLLYENKLFDQNFRLYDLTYDSNQNPYFITSNGIVKCDKSINILKQTGSWPLKTGAFTPDGKLWVSSGSFWGCVLPNGTVKKFLDLRTYAMNVVSSDKIWVGTIEGLFLYENGKMIKIDHPDLEVDIRDISRMENGDLLLATQKSGLYWYQPDVDSLLYHFSTKNGLSNDYCTKVFSDDRYIWLGTKKGINKIDYANLSISHFGIDQGLPSYEINHMHKDGKTLYVATNKGIAVFNEDIVVKRAPPVLKVSKVKIVEKDTVLHPHYLLEYHDNNIKIEFNSITFKNAEESVYEYKMEGLDQDWVQSDVGVAQYPSLPPGAYNFFVKTKTVNSDWSEPANIRFDIKNPFWKTWWFYLLSILLILWTIFIIIYEINRRNRALKNLRTSQLTAIRAQMNPHFVFNALNSIQEFILNKNTRSANRYLAQFARLMRNTLNFSEKEKITLSKELESLKLYLSLESLRFGNSFEYVFEIEESLDLESYHLPPLLIQPFVENAIKHGLMHKRENKKLYVRFYAEQEVLICEVEDNGVGRKKSSEIKKLNPNLYPSKATSLIEERVKLLNSISNNTLQIKIIDLQDESAKPSGTKVIIRIHSKIKGLH